MCVGVQEVITTALLNGAEKTSYFHLTTPAAPQTSSEPKAELNVQKLYVPLSLKYTFWELGQCLSSPGTQALVGTEGFVCDVSLKYVTSAGFRGKGDLQNFVLQRDGRCVQLFWQLIHFPVGGQVGGCQFLIQC